MGDVTIKTQETKNPLTLFQLVGAVLASFLSWQTYHSIFWSALCALLNWYFIVYWIIMVSLKHY